ncbi:hypothetical protein GCM10027217_05540 [Pseudomaricurvus hydrocarbonicus]
MRVQDLSLTTTTQVDRNRPPREVAFAMGNDNADCVIITDTSGGEGKVRPIGILTEKDLALFILDDVEATSAITVGELLNGELVTINESDSVNQAIALMSQHSIHRLPVTRSDGTLAGILTVDDLLHFLAQLTPRKSGCSLQQAV